MAFNSVYYILLFLPVAVLVAGQLHGRPWRMWLLVLSYVFYGAFDWRFLGLLLFSTVLDFMVAQRLADDPRPRRRTAWLLTSLVGNLGVLAVFKYFGFFVESADAFLELLGLQWSQGTIEVLLPAGISFYTFQTISYTVGVYRGTVQAERDLSTFALYVAFFPQLVAGPIERAERLLPRLRDPRRPDREEVRAALLLILLGLVKKVAIADVAATIANPVFASPGNQHWLMLLAGTYAFAVQIYGDFSGYTDIARGSAALLGVELTHNFTQPYLSRSITEFWRRWHISLSTWLRDYLYIPLGGNRHGARKTIRNLMITMLFGGLWHGAGWTFVVWGGLHGLMLAAHRWVRHQSDPDAPLDWRRDLWRVVGTFHLVCLSWIFFRADTFSGAWTMLSGILTLRAGDLDVRVVLLPLLMVATLGIDLALRRGIERRTLDLRVPALVQGAAAGVGVAAVLLFSGGPSVPFIYFRF